MVVGLEKKVLQLRLPAELHGRLVALKGVRSLNAEIVARLEQSVAVGDVSLPLDKLIVDVSPAPEIAGTPSTRLFESEKPRAGRRTLMCAHRVPVGSYCSRCD